MHRPQGALGAPIQRTSTAKGQSQTLSVAGIECARVGLPARCSRVSGGSDFRGMPPEIRYAKSNRLFIAYQVFGQGPPDLVVAPGYMSNVEQNWEWPAYARFMERLFRETTHPGRFRRANRSPAALSKVSKTRGNNIACDERMK